MRPTKNKPKKDKKNKFVVSPRPKKKINNTKQITLYIYTPTI